MYPVLSVVYCPTGRPLPLGRYKVVESRATDFYGLDKTPIEAEIEFAGQMIL